MCNPDDLDAEIEAIPAECLKKIRTRVEESLRCLEKMDIRHPEEAQRLFDELQMELRLQREDLRRAEQACRAGKKAEETSGEQGETSLRLSHRKHFLSAVMEALPTCVAITDRQGGIILANKACKRIWGGDLPETPSLKNYNSFKAWRADTDIPVAPEEWASAIAMQEGVTTLGQMMRIRRFDGADGYILNSSSPLYDQEGNIIGSAVATEDISELKRVEKALFESEQRLRLLIEQAPVALAMFDRELRYLVASRRWVRDIGMEGRDLTGLPAGKIQKIPKRWREAHRRGLAGEVVESEERFRRFDGEFRWIHWKIHPWRGATGKVDGIVVFTEDITERREYEEKLRHLNEELGQRVESRTRELQETEIKFLHAEKLSAIGRLSASIAHEFNNPLQGILAVLKGLQPALAAGQDREMLQLAVGECQRLVKLVKNLGEINRPSPARKTWMDVHDAISSLLLLCKNHFRRKGIAIELELTQDPPKIHAVPDQIKQVFLNLLTNAADACASSGGRITIRTRREDDRIVVSISDNGIGIEPDKKELIFQPFYSTKLDGNGTGLGLSVCSGIVSDHRGEIRVASEPGQGSTFTVVLPIDTT
jgi:PAS domain S-box-containing protein